MGPASERSRGGDGFSRVSGGGLKHPKLNQIHKPHIGPLSSFCRISTVRIGVASLDGRDGSIFYVLKDSIALSRVLRNSFGFFWILLGSIRGF